MNFDRRRLFAALAGAAGATAGMPALAQRRRFDAAPETETAPPRNPTPRASIDAGSLGLRPNATDDQSKVFQRAIEQAASTGAVLQLAPGVYRAGGLTLPSYAAIAGVPGATRLVMAGGPSLLTATGSERVSIKGLVLDGEDFPLPPQHGLVHLTQARSAHIADCEIVRSGRNGITLEAVEGEVTATTISAAADVALLCLDARKVKISGNTVRGAGNVGILVMRSQPGDDGTLVFDNRVEDTGNKAGGSGQFGNAINIFRAHNVMVRGNRISNAAFSAVRGNSSSNLQIIGNTCTDLGEVAIFVEFAFQGAIVANNIVDRAAVGVSFANFNVGGRLAVVQGNLLRNLMRGRPASSDQSDLRAFGITMDADTAAIGNVIENVEGAGIAAGWGPYLRDVNISANIVRGADYGITVSVVPGAGTAVIADNIISDARLGAIVGMEWKNAVTGDLAKDGAARYAQLSIGGNRVR